MSSIMQPLREEHQELLPQIERLRAVADVIGDASVETLQRAVDEVYSFLTLHLIPHAHAEDAALYPIVGKVMGAAQVTATMSRDHVEVGRLSALHRAWCSCGSGLTEERAAPMARMGWKVM